MTQLLALSFDSATSPSIRLRGVERNLASLDRTYGWGLAWYPSDGLAAMVLKDPTSIGTNALTRVLTKWERFSATVFVAHLRGAAKRRAAQDTHPFSRTWAGRDWVLTHNGDLRHGFRESLPLADGTPFEPIGRTDSEHVLCWLLDRLREQGIRRLRDWPPDALIATLREVNALGTFNAVLSDGDDVVAYSDAFGYRPLWRIRHTPPAPLMHVLDEEFELKVGTSRDLNRTAVVVCTRPLSLDPAWAAIEPGRALIVRRGAVVWESDPLPSAWTPRVPVAILDELADTHTPAPPAPLLEDAEEPEPPDRPEVDLDPRSEVAVAPPPEDVDPAHGVDALARAASTLFAPEVFTAGLTRERGDDQIEIEEAPRVLETFHETVYSYGQPVHHSTHVFRLQPVHDLRQELLDFRLHLEPGGPLRAFEDVFGNATTESVLRSPYEHLRIVAQARVRLWMPQHPRLRAAVRQSRIPLVWMPWQRQMMTPYLLPPELPETQLLELTDYAMGFVERQDFDLVETLKDINQTIHRDFQYTPASTTLATTPFDVYVTRRGVCQDFANLFIAMARLLGVPARYRVGYVFTGNRYDNTIQGDASHAWVEAYLPHVGWRGFDPTNGTLVGSDHVRVAAGRNYRDATPTGGTIFKGGGQERLRVDVRVIDVTERALEGGGARFSLGSRATPPSGRLPG